MFKEEKILLTTSFFLLLVLSTTLYFGQEEVITYLVGFLGIDSYQAVLFLENLFVVENEFFVREFNFYMGLFGYVLSLLLLLMMRVIKKPKRKQIAFAGSALLLLGFLQMILMDISVIGWLIGPMMMISGFLLYRKSFLFF